MESDSEVRSGSKASHFFRWLTTLPARRYSLPGLVAYYWTAGSPKACSVGNISTSGMYVHASEPWLPGSMIPMTLQEGSDDPEETKEGWIAVLARVVWAGPDGFGLAFVFSESAQMFTDAIPPERLANDRVVKRFLKRLRV
jgi:hypothetical protein